MSMRITKKQLKALGRGKSREWVKRIARQPELQAGFDIRAYDTWRVEGRGSPAISGNKDERSLMGEEYRGVGGGVRGKKAE